MANDAFFRPRGLSEQPTFKAPEVEQIPQTGSGGFDGQFDASAPAPKGYQAYLPAFADAARRYQVPVNVLMALAQQESNFNPGAIGQPTKWGRAKGMMQYLDSTAQGLGIDPLDPIQAIDGAARQLRERLDKGYTMIDAVREHFAGPNRELWGPKTAAYGNEVLQKAMVIGNNASSIFGDMVQPQQPQSQRAFGESGIPYKPEETAEAAPAAPSMQAQPQQSGPIAETNFEQDIEGNPDANTFTDLANSLAIGANNLALNVRELTSRIPYVGEGIVSTLDSVDKWMNGKESEELLTEYNENRQRAMSPEWLAAREKDFITETEDGYSLGPAFMDWRSYASGLTESLPETAVTMFPAIGAARTVYALNLARGVGTKIAAKRAAATATIAGGLMEGGLGGAASSRQVRDEINAMPQEALADSDLIKAMMAQGSSFEEARDFLANNSADRAFLIAGVLTGVFGGQGDRALAKIFTEGARNRLTAAGRGAVAEGVFEEAPQEAGQQMAENYAMQNADPDRRVMEGVANAAAGGAVLGGIMGGGIGGAAGGDRSRERMIADEMNRQVDNAEFATPAEEIARRAFDPNTPESREPSGPMGRAMDRAPMQEAATIPMTPEQQAAAEEQWKRAWEAEGVDMSVPYEGPTIDITQGQQQEEAQAEPDAAPEAEQPARLVIDGLEDPIDGQVIGMRDEGVLFRSNQNESFLIPREELEAGSARLEPIAESGQTQTEEPEAQAVEEPTAQEQPEQEEAPDIPEGVSVRSNGQPFDSFEQASKAMNNRKLKNHKVEQLPGGGWGIVERKGSIAEQAQRTVEQPAPREEPKIEDMGDEQLQQRMSFLRTQARSSGWDSRLVAERDRIQSELERRAQPEETTDGQDSVVDDSAADLPVSDVQDPQEAPLETAPTGEPVVEHTTKKGKTLRGVLRDIPIAEAKEIDPYAFRKDGQSFIRLNRLPEQNAEPETQTVHTMPDGTVMEGPEHEGAVPGSTRKVEQQEAAELVTKKDGSPFASEAVARRAATNRKLKGYEPVEVEGGWALQQVDQAQPSNQDILQAGIDSGRVEIVSVTEPKRKRSSKEPTRAQRQASEALGGAREGDTIRLNADVGYAIPGTYRVGTIARDGSVRVTNTETGSSTVLSRAEMMGASGNGPLAERVTEESPQATPETPRRPQPGEEGYTRDDAVSDLVDLRRQVAEQGMVVDDRLLQRMRRQEQLVREFDADETGAQQSATSEPAQAVGENEQGQPLYESDNGVRYVIEDGVRVNESVDKDNGRSRQYLTRDEVSQQGSAIGGASPNTIFTDDMAERARQVLRSKLTQLNSGIDPEIMQAGITLAGYHIEKGARTFAAYARAMVDDLGDSVKPYLKSWYMGVKYDPRAAGFEGMDDAATVEAADVDAATETNNVNQEQSSQERPAGDAQGDQPESAPSDRGPGSDEQSSGRAGERVRGDQTDDAGSSDERSASDGQPGLRAEPDETDSASNRANEPSGQDSNRASRRENKGPRDYRIRPGELSRTGSWRDTAEQNVRIVELVKQLDREGRPATVDEQELLTKFTGWGASEIANGVFPDARGNYKDARWKELGERLEAALTPEEYAQARRTTQYAHYTSEAVIRSVYDGMQRMGFSGGAVLEPGMGVGLFKGLMPTTMTGTYTGVEYDAMTGRIAQLLYPNSNIIVGDYAATKLPKDFFDAAIGNPPFSQTKVTGDPEYRKHSFMLHDYFFAKTIDRVKPGGMVTFITSKGTMDKASDRARKYLGERANLVGAIRLPQTAFKANAGTEVVTDVLFFQKRGEGIENNGVEWMKTKEVQTPQGTARINEYFADHPEMVLGKHAMTGSMYRANEYTVEPDGRDIEQAFAEAIENLPENIYRPERGSRAEQAAVIDRDFNPDHKKEGGIYIKDGELLRVEDGVGIPLTDRTTSTGKQVPLKPKEVEWLKGYAGVRDALKRAQADQLTDGDWESSLAELNRAYDEFVKKHGPIRAHTVTERENEDGSTTIIRRFKNQPLLDLDVENPLVFAIEDILPDNSIVKAPALKGRTLEKPKEAKIQSTQDALFVSLNRIGRLDLDNIAELANISRNEVIEELGDLIYNDPSSGWVMSDEYLSGDVVKKLKEARQAAKINKALERNVKALESVQPRPLAPADITAQLGSAWIPTSDVEAFASEVMGQDIKVQYSPIGATWSAEGGRGGVSEWSTPARDTDKILEAVLNNRQIKVTWRDQEGKTHTDLEATELANNVAKKMREEFKGWLWRDKDRTDRLVSYYNEHFNNIVPRTFDGTHLTLPGVSMRFDLYPHQKRAIWRAIQNGDSYFAHSVGAGKTFSMIAAGMEERRLGLINKPMYVVPNHMLAQFSKEFLELYPTANIMVADEKNFHTRNRQRFVAQAALNDPDAIIITHSAFGLIGMSDEFQENFIRGQIDNMRAVLEEADSDDRLTRKRIEQRIEQLENRIKAKTSGKKDKALTFEQLGVDRLYVDEIQEFRKLDFATNRGNVKGIDPSGSMAAMDLNMKVQYLREKNPGRALVGASGTPITNTMGELFTVQRLFQPEQLEADGLDSFDAWSNQFGEVVDGFEQNAAGGYQVVSRFAKFVNVADLMSRVRSFMDVLTSEQLGDLVQRPSVSGGAREVVVTPTPDGYKDYQKELNERIKAIQNRSGPPQPGDDIILNVIADGRFSAIDMRFVDPTLEPDPNSKLNRLLDDVIEAYNDTKGYEYRTGTTKDANNGGNIIVFTDLGLGEASAKNRGFDMKAWMRKRLIDGGVNPEHIAFMRDNKAHAKKERLFADMREGKKRILIGGKDMETGVNVQKRLTHLFHLDAPWFPAAVEQREGRIIRQGNQNQEVSVKAYATKGSYDSTMWGMIARKARFIEQAMAGDSSLRSMDDVSEASSFEMASALASGDERYLRLAGLKADVERLSRLYSAHMSEQRSLSGRQRATEDRIRHDEKKAAELEKALKKRQPIAAGEFTGTVGKTVYDSREDFSEAMFEAFKTRAGTYRDGSESLGKVGGFDVMFNGLTLQGSGDYAADLTMSIPGDPEPLAVFPIDEAMSVRGIATRAANQVNRMDRDLAEARQSIETNRRRLEQIENRVGAPFPEADELAQKQEELTDLEMELSRDEAAQDAPTQDQAEAFNRWFADSKVVDEEGKPLVVYHGTGEDFDTFSDEFYGEASGQLDLGEGFYFTDRPDIASDFAGSTTPSVMPVYLSIQNPATNEVINSEQVQEALSDDMGFVETQEVLAGMGYDGIIYDHGENGGKEYVVFKPTQIKSSIGNLGTFDPENPNIRYSVFDDAGTGSTVNDITDAIFFANPVVADLLFSGRVQVHQNADTMPSQRKTGVLGFTDRDGNIHLNAASLTPDMALPVLYHEAFHAGARSLLGDARWKNLYNRLGKQYAQAQAGRLRGKFWDDAMARVENADPAHRVEEFGAYAIEEYQKAPPSVKKIIDGMIGAVKAFLLRRFGIQAGQITPAQLRNLARAALGVMNRTPAQAAKVPYVNGLYSVMGKNKPTEREINRHFKGMMTDAKPTLLAVLPLDRLLNEVAKGIPQAREYLRIKRRMDAYRNKKHGQYDDIAQKWLKLNSRANKGHIRALSEIMHESTLLQHDPSKQSNDPSKLTKEERDMRKRFRALPQEFRDLYVEVRDTYANQAKELDQIIMDNIAKSLDVQAERARDAHDLEINRINQSGLSEAEKDKAKDKADRRLKAQQTKLRWNKAARMMELRQQFESNRMQGPYFPLARFGEYFVTVRDKSGEVVAFYRREKASEQQALAKEMRDQGYKVTTGYMSNDGDLRKAVDPNFVADVEEILGSSSVDDTVKDQIWQRYLETMPEFSLRKSFIHRKGREGYDQDALRAFSSRMFHSAHQMARLKYGQDLQQQIDRAEKDARYKDDSTRDDQIIAEMKKRHDFVMNPKAAAWATKITGAAFIYYLSVSPAAAAVNTTQTVIMGVPILGTQFGYTKTQKELMRALKDFTAGRGQIGKSNLTSDEKQALDEAYERGTIDKTQAHDLAGVGETGTEYSARRNKWMSRISFLYHHAERMNREVTFMAAYRMSRDKGMSHDEAVENASELTWKTHFDYSNTNRPRPMQNDWVRIFTIFRNFQVNMLFRLFRDFQQSIKGESKADRREARKQFGATMAMFIVNAGIRGTPLFGLAMMLANMFDDDDDAEEDLKRGIIEFFGPSWAGQFMSGVALNGLLGHVSRAALSERIGFPDLWFRSSNRDLEGKDQVNYMLEQLLGPGVGMLSNIATRAYTFPENPWRSTEGALPKFARDIMKAYRYTKEGALTYRGDPILEYMTPYESLVQAMGFTPIALNEAYDRNNAMKNREQRILDERQRLLTDFWNAQRSGKSTESVIDGIGRFNSKYPEMAITPETVQQSMRSRMRYTSRNEGGIILNPRLNPRLREEAAPTIYR